MVAVYIRTDIMYNKFSRKVTDILSLLADIGGLQGFFISIGIILISFLT